MDNGDAAGITLEKMDTLLTFLPEFEQPNRQFILDWVGPIPNYASDVSKFVGHVMRDGWMDNSYKPSEALQMIEDDAFIAQADIPEIRLMLTFFVRGERFSDGFWGGVLKNGRLQAVLHRLSVLRDGMAPLSESLQITLVDLQQDVIDSWQTALEQHPNISIHHGSIFDVPCDAIVSPANSFGFMDGGIDLAITRFFGPHIQERVQTAIQQEYDGELLVGQALIVPTDHEQIPYLISAPTMRVPMRLTNSINVYLATRAVLLLIQNGRFPDGTPLKKTIQHIAIPGMGTGVGQLSPAICARQMAQAITDILDAQAAFPTSWADAQKQHQHLLKKDAN